LLDHGLTVVLSLHLGLADDPHQAAAFSGRQRGVQQEGVENVAHGNADAAGGLGGGEGPVVVAGPVVPFRAHADGGVLGSLARGGAAAGAAIAGVIAGFGGLGWPGAADRPVGVRAADGDPLQVAHHEADLDAQAAGIVAAGLHDPGFNFHLVLRHIQGLDQLADLGDTFRNVPDNQRVGPDVGLDLARLGQDGHQFVEQLGGGGVVQLDDVRDGFTGPFQLFPRLLFRLEGIQSADAHDVPLDDLGQAIVFHRQVEHLVPWHVVDLDRDGAGDARVDDDVQSLDIADQPEEVDDVRFLDVQGDEFAGVLHRLLLVILNVIHSVG